MTRSSVSNLWSTFPKAISTLRNRSSNPSRRVSMRSMRVSIRSTRALRSPAFRGGYKEIMCQGKTLITTEGNALNVLFEEIV